MSEAKDERTQYGRRAEDGRMRVRRNYPNGPAWIVDSRSFEMSFPRLVRRTMTLRGIFDMTTRKPS